VNKHTVYVICRDLAFDPRCVLAVLPSVGILLPPLSQAKGYVQGAVDQVVGATKNAAGYVTGNSELQNEGKAQQSGGDAGKAMNK
jgi:uncharacterized protein YjbJ (UPF0337 family)